MAELIVYDDIYHKPWRESTTQLCPHPGVKKAYGHGGECRVSVYTCFKCSFVVRYKYHGGVSCGYRGGDP